MRSAIFFSLAAVAVAQMNNEDSDSSAYTPSYSNPNTAYLSMTDSRGVVTGMPTSIPPVVTELPEVATSPAGSNSVPTVVSTSEDNRRSTAITTGALAGVTGGGASNGMMSMSSGAIGYGSGMTMSGGMGSGATPTSSGRGRMGGMGGMGGNSDSDSEGSGGSATGSSGASQSSGAASSSFQVSTGLLGLVGAAFAAFL